MSDLRYFLWTAPDGSEFIGSTKGNRGSSVNKGTVQRNLQFQDDISATVSDWRAGSLVVLSSSPQVPEVTVAPPSSLTQLALRMATLGNQQVNLQTRQARKDTASTFK